MRSCSIYYFSGTGNSRRIARLACGILQDDGLQVTVRSIETGGPAQPSADLVGFVFPVHAFGVAKTMDDFMRRLPSVEGKRAFVISVHGDTSSVRGHPGDAVRQAACVLAGRGYEVLAGDSVGMPANFVAVMNAPRAEAAGRMDSRAQRQLKGLLGKLLRGEPSLRVLRRPLGVVCSAVHRMYRFGLRHFSLSGRLFYADSDCAGCGICAMLCPADNISLRQGKPQWGGGCHACFRCINICPQSAIQMPTGTRRRRRYREPHLDVEQLIEEITGQD